MSRRDLVVIGAGGFGREVIDVVRAINTDTPATWNLVGVVDDDPSDANLSRLADLGVPHLGGLDDFASSAHDGISIAIGIGSPHTRSRIVRRLASSWFDFPALLHPSATIGSHFRCGRGTIVCAGVSIGTNVELAEHVHLNAHAVIGHDAVLEDFVSMNPASSVSGDCYVQTGALIGVGAVVLNQLTVGAGSVVGGAACVVKDVAPGSVMVGVPAAPLASKHSEGTPR